MRKKIFVISILICSSVIYSFASSKIGYKDFALGDTLSDVEKKCLKHDPNYRCCVLHLDSSTGVSFEYYNKIVMKIQVITDNVTVEDYNDLVKYLKNKYGKPAEISDHDIPSYTWYFNKKDTQLNRILQVKIKCKYSILTEH